MAEPGSPEQQTKTGHLLPELPPLIGKKGASQNFTEFAQLLNTDKDKKDEIYIWWRKQPELEQSLVSLQTEINKPTLPKNEADFARQALGKELDKAVAISNQILEFLANKPSEFSKRIHDPLSALGFGSKQDNAAEKIAEDIEDSKEAQATTEICAAICAAINETRGVNPDENIIRKKIAQSVFDEMLTHLSYDRLRYKGDLENEETSIIDSPFMERLDLTAVLSGKPWTGDERRKRLRDYNKLKRVLNIVGSDSEVKVALNTLWKWANGNIPKGASVFSIMEYTEDLYGGIGEPLADAWQAEVDREEDSEEDESDEE